MSVENYHAFLINHKVSGLDAVKMASSIPSKEIYLGLIGAVPELAVLKTCNRFEIYWYGEQVERVTDVLLGLLSKRTTDVSERAKVIHGLDVVKHLFRVASGVDSLLLGENEILGQVKRAMEEASMRGALGPYLRLLFHRAVITGKRVRRETEISKGVLSIPSAAVKLAEELLGGLEGRRVVVVGAGKAGELLASALSSKGVDLCILNRTVYKAKTLAERLKARWGGLDRMKEELALSEVVFLAVSGGPILSRKDLPEGRELLIVDISVPPVVSDLGSEARLVTIDNLKKVVEENRKRREKELPKVEAILGEETELFIKLLNRKVADEILAKVVSRAEDIRKRELSRVMSSLKSRGIAVEGDVEFLLEMMSRSIVRKVLHPVFMYARMAAERGDISRLNQIAEMLCGDREGEFSQDQA